MKKPLLFNEKPLIKSIVEGNAQGYKKLYELYYSDLCIYITSLCNDDEFAKDIVQQTIIKIWQKRQKFDVKYSLKKYLFKIAYNEFIDTRRKKSKEIKLIEELTYNAIIDQIETKEENLEQKLELLKTEMDKLPKQSKKVFLLGKKDGLKYREIAVKLNISVKTVEAHMTIAFKKLKKTMKLGSSKESVSQNILK